MEEASQIESHIRTLLAAHNLAAAFRYGGRLPESIALFVLG